jgi:hypothetical protein
VTAPQPVQPVAVAGVSLRRILLVVGAILFVLGSLTAGGNSVGGVPEWSWGFAAFAAFSLAWAV